MADIEISRIQEPSDDFNDALVRLVPQLSSSGNLPTAKHVERMLGQDDVFVLVARQSGPDSPIIGMLVLVVFVIPTGVRAIIEDVVVDDQARGQGVGESLTRAGLDVAREQGAVTVDLTSRPTREAANRLYKRVGFEERDTNVYRYTL